MSEGLAIPLEYLSYDEARYYLDGGFIPPELKTRINKRVQWLEDVRKNYGENVFELSLSKIRNGQKRNNNNYINHYGNNLNKTYAQVLTGY